LGVGLALVRIYPKYYLKRLFTSQPIDRSLIPGTAKELIFRMPMGFRPEAAGNLKAEIQFDLSEEGGVKGVLSISEGKCSFREGDSSSATLTIRSLTDVWMKIARQEINRTQALVDEP
jgi:putative sterol carrier protein